MTTEPTDERLLLLAQIALEGVRMTPEAQEIATVERLQGILTTAIRRSAVGGGQHRYIALSGHVVATPNPFLPST